MSERQNRRAEAVERRRQQNVVAQRAYRAKQRERLKNLERLVAAAVVGGEPDDAPSATAGPSGLAANSPLRSAASSSPTSSLPAVAAAATTAPPEAGAGDLEDATGTAGAPSSATTPVSFSAMVVDRRRGRGPTSTEFLAPLRTFTPREAETCMTIIERERFGFRDVVKYGLISLGYAMDPTLFASAKSLPMREWLGQMARTANSSEPEAEFVKLVFWAGLRLLANFQVPRGGGSDVSSSLEPGRAAANQNPPLSCFEALAIAPQVPCPAISVATSNLTMSQLAVAAAMRENAIQLRINILDIAADDGQSPYYQKLLSDIPKEVRPDLVPTAAQLAVPHHPCFDLVPWPDFRNRALLAISMDPPLANEEDICLDVLNDGLVCWGSTGGSMHGRGQGAPWDGRSWEAAPWFLEKYEFLSGGRQGEMWRNSEWWRFMRGQQQE